MRGYANVVEEVPGRRGGIQMVESDSTQVELTYMLTKMGNWRCNGVYVETIPDLGRDDPRSPRTSGRIGW